MNELQKITSRDNQRLISARRIRDGHGAGKMFVEGKRLAIEALRSGLEISECFVSERFVQSSENETLLDLVSVSSRFMFELPDRVFFTIAATENTQGIVIIAERPHSSAQQIERRLADNSVLPVVLVLFEINNPSNLGAVLRTAEAVNVAGVIITRNSTDVYSPKALRAAMGAAFRIPVWTEASYDLALEWAREHRLATTATIVAHCQAYTELDWKMPRLLIFGSESHGLGPSELASVEQHIRIPMENDVESLNIAVAAGIVMFEAKRQND
ncbi:MAG: RNA methyltransferase [Acidobacteriota bacterium]